MFLDAMFIKKVWFGKGDDDAQTELRGNIKNDSRLKMIISDRFQNRTLRK